MGDKQNGPFQLSFNACLKVDFQGSRVTSDGGLILVRELDEKLGFGELIDRPGQARSVLLAAAGREPPDVTVVRSDGEVDGGVASAGWLGRHGGEANRSKAGGAGEVYKKPFGIRRFRPFRSRKERGGPPPWPRQTHAE